MGESESYKASGAIKMAKAVYKGSRLMSRPPGEGPAAESANRAYWPGRPF